MPCHERNELIACLSGSSKEDVTGFSHRNILFKVLNSKNLNYEGLSLILERISPLQNKQENLSFLKATKTLSKMSLKKIDLLINFYEKNRFIDENANSWQETIFNYLVVNNEIVGISTPKNKKTLLEGLYERFLTYQKENRVTPYYCIAFYNMIASRTENPRILISIFKEMMKLKEPEAFRLRNKTLAIIVINTKTPVDLINNCFRVLSKDNILSLIGDETFFGEKLYKMSLLKKLNKKSFYILYKRIGFFEFRKVVEINKYTDALNIQSKLKIPNQIKTAYLRKYAADLNKKIDDII